MSLGCARCGQCCDPVFIDFSVWTGVVADARRYNPPEQQPKPRGEWANRVFIAANMRPIGARHDQVMLRCRFYDAEHRMCGAYDKRPPMCTDYPWYGTGPDEEHIGGVGPQCSYLLDVAPELRPEGSRPLIPLTVL